MTRAFSVDRTDRAPCSCRNPWQPVLEPKWRRGVEPVVANLGAPARRRKAHRGATPPWRFKREPLGQHAGGKLVRGVGPCCAKRLPWERCWPRGLGPHCRCHFCCRRPALAAKHHLLLANAHLQPFLLSPMLWGVHCSSSHVGLVLASTFLLLLLRCVRMPWQLATRATCTLAHACCKQLQHMLASMNQRAPSLRVPSCTHLASQHGSRSPMSGWHADWRFT